MMNILLECDIKDGERRSHALGLDNILMQWRPQHVD